MRRKLHEARSEIHGLPEDVVAAGDDRAPMEANPDGQLLTGKRRQLTQCLMHADGGVGRLVGIGEDRHQSVARMLDDPAAPVLDRLVQFLEAAIHELESRCVADAFIELRAADQVGKQDSALGWQGGRLYHGSIIRNWPACG